MAVKIFTTGGTIDSLDYNSEDKAPKNPKSIISVLLKKARISDMYSIEILFMKDSRFVTDGDSFEEEK